MIYTIHTCIGTICITEEKMHTYYEKLIRNLKEISDGNEWSIKKNKACIGAWTTQT